MTLPAPLEHVAPFSFFIKWPFFKLQRWVKTNHRLFHDQLRRDVDLFLIFTSQLETAVHVCKDSIGCQLVCDFKSEIFPSPFWNGHENIFTPLKSFHFAKKNRKRKEKWKKGVMRFKQTQVYILQKKKKIYGGSLIIAINCCSTLKDLHKLVFLPSNV